MGKVIGLIIGTFFLVLALVLFTKPVPQPLSYHDFADKHMYLGIKNCLNVISNACFLFTGGYGLYAVRRSGVFPMFKWVYYWLFIGIIWTAFGSAYYHFSPDNNSLVWDRIPMTIVFMSLLSATVAEFIDTRAGILLFPLLLIAGIGSVWWWHYTESLGRGDLRAYLLVQFYPVLVIPVILVLFPATSYQKGVRQLVMVVIWYVIAKLFEQFDNPVFSMLHVVSGHTLKHVAAGVSTWYLVRLFQVKHG